ncbi:MAG: hypothetical protein M3Y56_04805, partial [Armatimonadota bacterium]|nr:hypothetical protein [Armatimonadota bacterium]
FSGHTPDQPVYNRRVNKRTSWTPSILIIVGSAVFLGLTLRGTGPTGPGIPAMLQMQSAWESLPAIHASGAISEWDAGAPERRVAFEFWKSKSGQRKVIFTPAGLEPATTTIITPEHAWKWIGPKGRVQELDPSKADLFPLPDPDAPDATYYRHARRWTLGAPQVVNGVSCIRTIGEAAGGRFTFDLDNRTHLPRRVEIVDSGPKGGRRMVEFNRMDTPPSIPDSAFQPR